MLHVDLRPLKGGTLLELVITITLLTIFLASLYGFAFHVVADNRRAARSIREIQAASRALDLMKERVRCARRASAVDSADALALEMPDGSTAGFTVQKGALIESLAGKPVRIWTTSVASLRFAIEGDGRYVGIEVRMKGDGKTDPEFLLAGGACLHGVWSR